MTAELENTIAKLFSKPYDAVLRKTTDPGLVLSFEWEGLIVDATLGFEDSEDGYAVRDKAFVLFTEEEAESMMINMTRELQSAVDGQ